MIKIVKEDTRDLAERVTTYEQVCFELNRKVLTIEDFEFLPVRQRVRALAHHKIQNIEELFNAGWKPDWDNDNERKWYPYFIKRNGGWFFYVSCCYSFSYVMDGFYQTEELSNLMGSNPEFRQIHIDYITN